MITGTSPPGALASTSIPPWPGGEPLRGGVLGSGCADHPPVHSRRAHNPAPRVALSIPGTSPRDHARQLLLLLACLNQLEVVEGGYGLIHQLFCHLRHRENCALRDGILESDLGHFDHVLRNHGVEWPEHFHKLVHCLRHWSIEQRGPTGT